MPIQSSSDNCPIEARSKPGISHINANRLLGILIGVLLYLPAFSQITGLNVNWIQTGIPRTIFIYGNGLSLATTVVFQHPTAPSIPGTVITAFGNGIRVSVNPPANAQTGTYTIVTSAPVSSFNIELGSMNSITPDTVETGSSFSLVVTGSNTNFTAATTAWIATIIGNGIIAPYSMATSIHAFSDTLIAANFALANDWLPGDYWFVTGTNKQERIRVLRVNQGPSGPYGRITGRVFIDANQNCFYSVGDSIAVRRRIQISSGNGFAVQNSQGIYEKWLLPGNYNANLVTHPSEIDFCNTHTRNFTVTQGSATTHHFYLDSTKINDLLVTVQPPTFRPGFTGFGIVGVKNIGNQSVMNAALDLTFPPFWNGVSGWNQGYTINSNVIHWNIGTLYPFESRMYFFSGTTPSSVALGTAATVSATATPIAGDITPGNNTNTTYSTVRGSYDPNDKHVRTEDGQEADGGIEPSDSILRYMIRFQNTGTDTAFNIYVRDTLDPSINFASFHTIASSHQANTFINEFGEVEWFFGDILLPDSNTNERLSHGYIIYEVKLKAGLPMGTQIMNSASIYFDFNAPVLTNTVVSTICPEMDISFTSTFSNYTVNLIGSASGAYDSLWWDLGDGNTSTQLSLSHTFSTAGFYTVCLYGQNSCGVIESQCVSLAVDTIYTNVKVPQGVNAGFTTRLYPNPANDRVSLEISLNQIPTSRAHIEFYDLRGIKQVDEELSIEGLRMIKDYDLSALSKGMYFIRITMDGKSAVHKLRVK